MYEMTSNAALGQILNQFSVPMFAIERTTPNAPFKFVYLNDAMESAAGCDRSTVIGKTLQEALPDQETDVTHQRLEQCIQTQGVVRFRDAFAFTSDRTLWDTTLQSALLADGRARVVGTSIQHVLPAAPQSESVAFDDIQYFSSMADFQIQNLISLFETYKANDLFEVEAEQRIAKLSGMCRTVQRAVSDIKKSVRSAQVNNHLLRNHPQGRPAPQRQAMINRCGTLKVLTEFSAEQNS